jgi:hypothetical protein
VIGFRYDSLQAKSAVIAGISQGGPMYKTKEDFLNDLETECASTQKLLEALTDVSLSQEVVPGHRTLGRIIWHIVTTISEMMAKTGIVITTIGPDAPMPGKAAEFRRA